MVQKKALVLGGTNAHIPLLTNLRKRGYFTILIDYHEHPVAKPHADTHLQISTLHKTQVLDAAKEHKVDLVISTCIDQANAVACWVSEKLGLPSAYSYEVAERVSQKDIMKKTMIDNNIPTAAYHEISSIYDIDTSILSFPLVVKPADSNSSKGVRIVRNGEMLEHRVTQALEISRKKSVIIEEFIEGREICIDCVIQNKQLTIISFYEKFNLLSDTYVIQCFRSLRPIPLPSELTTKLEDILYRIIEAFELENTVLFIQTICREFEVFVIELAARAAGGIASDATFLATNFSMVDAAVSMALGEEVHFTSLHTPQGYITTNSIYASESVFGYCTGQEKLLAHHTIEAFIPYKTEGMKIGPHLTSTDRVAGFLVQANSEEELWSKTEKALSTLQIFDSMNQPVMLKAPFEKVWNHHITLT